MNKTKQCSVCGKYLPHTEFWSHKADDRIWKHHREREYLFHKCKKCCINALNYNNLDSVLQLLKDFDIPYVEYEWNKSFSRWGKKAIGRYLSFMKLFSFYGFGFCDSNFLNDCYEQAQKRERERKERHKKDVEMCIARYGKEEVQKWLDIK